MLTPPKLSKTWLKDSFFLLYFQFLASDDFLSSTYISIYVFPLPKTHCLPLIWIGPDINLSSLVCHHSKLCNGRWQSWVQPSFLPGPSWLTLGKFFNFLQPQFPKLSLFLHSVQELYNNVSGFSKSSPGHTMGAVESEKLSEIISLITSFSLFSLVSLSGTPTIQIMDHLGSFYIKYSSYLFSISYI